jgi:2-oxoglutarate ferredoxin oxidoreductase subunit beta
MGSVEQSFNPISIALAAECTFIARTVDVFQKHMPEVFKAAASHRGTSFVEIYQNCIIFNQTAWEHVTEGPAREENVLYLEHGKPMIFGKNRDKGIRLRGLAPEVVQLGEDGSEDDLLVHDQYAADPTLAWMLSRMEPPNFPVPVGVFRSIEKPAFADQVVDQQEKAQARRGLGDLKKLLHDSDTWVVEETRTPVAAGVAGVNGSAQPA